MCKTRLPIVTTKEGNKITKVCVEDMYKILNRIIESMDKAHNNSIDIIDSVDKEVNGYFGSLIVGTGISQPNIEDAFDEEIGNNIAFMKAKLSANIKKRNVLLRIWKEYAKVLRIIALELKSIENYMAMDLYGIRQYNPDYLKDSYGEIEIEEEDNCETES